MRTLLVEKIFSMKTLRLNLFLAALLTAVSLFVVLIPYSLFLGWNLGSGVLFWFVLVPIVANLSSGFFRFQDNLVAAISGELLFYAFMVFMTYKHYNSDLFILMLYSVLPTLFLLVLYNIRQVSFFQRKKTNPLH